jgi:DNA-binding transcriptional LysR family regulator
MSEDRDSTSDKSERDRWLAIELRHLAALATVAERASFSGAADSLGYVQSAVSQQIGSLERIVGRRLVDRSARPRSVSVTAAGRTLLDHVEEILEQLTHAKADIDALTRRPEHVISFGIDSIFGSWLAAALFGALLGEAGSQDWDRIERGPSAELLSLVADGRLDAAFVPLPIASGPFFALELTRQEYVLAAPAEAVARARSAGAILERLPLVAVEGCPATAALLARRGGAEAPPSGPHSANGPLSALALVRSGVAAAVMTARDVPCDDPSVATVPLPDPAQRVVGMAWHRERDDCPAIGALRAAAQRALAA